MERKDWADDAANEISKYEWDQSTAPEIAFIIRQHLPTLPRCDQCKHWDRFELEDKGICHLAERAILFAAETLETREEFGCVSWEAK